MLTTLPRILILDDDPNLLATFSDILRLKGFNPVVTQTAAAALAVVAEQFVPIALIDLHLGDEISGLDVLKIIRQRSPQTECILLTGFASQNSAIEAIQLGVFGYFQKPFDMPQVLLSIQRALEKHAAEAALLHSEAKYRLLFQNAHTGIILFDNTGKFQLVNEKIATMLGGAPEDFIGKSLFDVFPDQAEFHMRRFSKIAQDKKGGTFEDPFPLPDGIHWFSSDIQPVFDSECNITGIQILSIDITERKRAEGLLIESETKLQAILANSTDAIGVSIKGIHSFANPAYVSMFGYKEAEELVGTPIDNLIAPENREMVLKNIRNHANGLSAPSGYEVVGLRKDGTTFIMDVRVSTFLLKNERYTLVILRDISERKRLETALENRLIALTQPLNQAENIDFKNLFDLESIQQIQDDFSAATGVASLITYPDGTAITRPSNFCHLCSGIIRQTEKGRINCVRSDAEIGRFHAEGPIIQPCMSGGLWDAGAGISAGGQHIANWLIGQVRDETQTEEKMREYARSIGADETATINAFYEVPAMKQTQFQNVAQALFTMANHLSTIAYHNVQQARFITEREQIEKALRASEQNFREIFNSTAEAIFIGDAETGKMIDVNDTMLKIYGYESKEQVLAGTIGDLSANEPPYTQDVAQEYIRRAIQGDPQIFEWLGKRRDGSTFWAEVSLKRSQIGGKGRALTVVRDISGRKLMEDGLRKSEERWQFALEGANDGVWDWNPQTNDVFFSRQWKALLGYDDQEIGNNFEEWVKRIHPEDREQCFADLKRHFDGETPIYQNEHRLLCKDGTYKWILDRGKTFVWTKDNKPLRVIGIHSDITQSKLAEKKLNEQVEELKRWHRATMGREDRIMDLKREINKLLSDAGKPPRYASVAETSYE